MNVILILRIFLTAAGVLFLLGDINAYVRQKLTDTIGLLWAFVSVALILTGVVSVPKAKEEEYLVVLLLAVCLLLLILLFKLKIRSLPCRFPCSIRKMREYCTGWGF